MNLSAEPAPLEEDLGDFFAEMSDFPLEAHDARSFVATRPRVQLEDVRRQLPRGVPHPAPASGAESAVRREAVSRRARRPVLPAHRAVARRLPRRRPLALPLAEPRDEHLRRLDERRGDRSYRSRVVHGVVPPLLRRSRRRRRRRRDRARRHGAGTRPPDGRGGPAQPRRRHLPRRAAQPPPRERRPAIPGPRTQEPNSRRRRYDPGVADPRCARDRRRHAGAHRAARLREGLGAARIRKRPTRSRR